MRLIFSYLLDKQGMLLQLNKSGVDWKGLPLLRNALLLFFFGIAPKRTKKVQSRPMLRRRDVPPHNGHSVLAAQCISITCSDLRSMNSMMIQFPYSQCCYAQILQALEKLLVRRKIYQSFFLAISSTPLGLKESPSASLVDQNELYRRRKALSTNSAPPAAPHNTISSLRPKVIHLPGSDYRPA